MFTQIPSWTDVSNSLAAVSYEGFLSLLAIFGFSWLMLYLIRWIILSQFQRYVINRPELSNLINTLANLWGMVVLLFLAMYIALQFVVLPPTLTTLVNAVLIVVLGWYVIRTVQAFVEYGFDRFISRKRTTTENFDPTVVLLFKTLTQITIWILVALLVLQNLGVQITALIGGLGIGGIAIAFAVQNILGDIFSSVSIYFDKPFTIGDFIVVGNDMGTVSHIGVKSTRLKTLQGEELVIPNRTLTESKIHNYKKLQRRRVVFQIGVTYETPRSKLEKIPSLVEKIITDLEDVSFDRAHLKNFGDSSLNYEIVYFLEKGEFNFYMDVQQDINLHLIEQFQKEKIEFAYPVRRIIQEKA